MSKQITKRANKSRRVGLKFSEETKTEQSHKNALNVNQIVKKYQKTGLWPNRKGQQPMYGDFTNIEDFHNANNRIIQAREDFLALPSEIREQFDNDPGQLVEFINDPDNIEEAQEMGLLPGKEKIRDNIDKKQTSITEPTEGSETKKEQITQINSETAK